MFKAIVKILHKNSTFAFEQQIHFLNNPLIFLVQRSILIKTHCPFLLNENAKNHVICQNHIKLPYTTTLQREINVVAYSTSTIMLEFI